MVTPVRFIALLVSLAVVLAGPVSTWAATGDCCCVETAAQVDVDAADSCCGSEAPADQNSHDEEPGDCPSDCDACVWCATMGQFAKMSRPALGLDLPDPQPDTLTALEPQSHAIEAHFSLLRPPRG